MEEIIQEALNKGVELHVAGEFDLASQLYESVIKLQPDHADANHNMGVLKLTTGNDLEALSYLQKALQADMSIAQFWLSYTKALIKLERKDEATRILDLARENGLEGEEFVELRQLLTDPNENKSVTETEGDVPRQTKPNIVDTLKLDGALKLAKKQMQEGATEDAKLIYQDILCKFPKNLKAQKGLAAADKKVALIGTRGPSQEMINGLITLYNQGQLAEAVEYAQEIIEKYPDAFMAWNVLGMACKGLGKCDEAMKAFTIL